MNSLQRLSLIYFFKIINFMKKNLYIKSNDDMIFSYKEII